MGQFGERGEATTGMLMSRLGLSRSPASVGGGNSGSGGWQMTALGVSAPAMTARGSIKRAQQQLRESRYLPTQKFLNTASTTSSCTSRPVNSASASRLCSSS